MDKSNGVDYTCTAKFYADEKGRLHIVDVRLNPPKKSEKKNMSDKNFEPELGHMAFGQDWQQYDASPLLEAALVSIDSEIDRIMWNINQERFDSPFSNSGNGFECPAFKVEAYSWSESYNQLFNFKWKDVEISWYKYLGRDTSVNQEISNDKIAEMLNDCLAALRKFEDENDKNKF